IDDPRDLKAFVNEISLDRVEDDRADHVAHMGRLIDRRSAEIHSHMAGADRLKQFLLLGKRVVDAKTHGRIILAAKRIVNWTESSRSAIRYLLNVCNDPLSNALPSPMG